MKYMTKEWYVLCQLAGRPPFDKSLNEYVHKISATYWDEYKRIFPCPPDFMKTLNKLHDCDIISAKLVGNDYVIIIDNGAWGIEGTTEILCKNATVIKQDFNDQELGWCYDELYLTANGYELHVLLFEYGSLQVFDLIIECEKYYNYKPTRVNTGFCPVLFRTRDKDPESISFRDLFYITYILHLSFLNRHVIIISYR